jgi:hypothetical protein
MKKLILSALLSFFVVGAAYATAPTYGTTDATYEYGGLATTISSGVFDTLKGVDSTTLISNFVWEPDWQYVLVRDAITGTGSDSVAIQVRADCLNSSGNLLYSVLVDSLTASEGEAIFLPLSGTLFGSKLRIKLVGYAGNGGEVILNKFYIFKRRPLSVVKQYR